MLSQGDLHQYLKEKGALSPSTAINFALDIARYCKLPFAFLLLLMDGNVEIFVPVYLVCLSVVSLSIYKFMLTDTRNRHIIWALLIRLVNLLSYSNWNIIAATDAYWGQWRHLPQIP